MARFVPRAARYSVRVGIVDRVVMIHTVSRITKVYNNFLTIFQPVNKVFAD